MKKKVFCLYLDSDLKEQLNNEAETKGLSLNSYIIMLLLERCKS